MRSPSFFLLILGLMLLLDFYVFQAVKTITHQAAARTRTIVFFSYWGISLAAVLLFLILPYLKLDNFSKGIRSVVFSILIALFFAKLIAAVFLLVDDIRRFFQWIAARLFFSNTEGEELQPAAAISRSQFLSWAGLAAGGGLFATLIYGFANKYQYTVRRVALQFPNLPASFKGVKVVQISDVHSGSFNNRRAVAKGIDKILSLQPDLILFTGDLVNNRADEMSQYKEIFARLKAPLGVYSVLGNHDYGDYENWESPEQKRQNLQHLKQVHRDMGWNLLLNEHSLLERNGHRIALLGVENWSAKARFPKYGRLNDAYTGTEDVPFKILLSHDPSHWDAEVRPNYPDIDLMLSGHTHGMQFGVEVPGFRWSPVQYVYEQWAGLYEKDGQRLYVNRGFGFLGYPGRVGILPEITLLEFS